MNSMMVTTMTNSKNYDFEIVDQLEFLERYGLKKNQLKKQKLNSPFFDRCLRQWAILLPAQKMGLPFCPFCEEADDLFLQIAWIGTAYKTKQDVHIEYRYWIQCGEMGCWTQGPMRTTATGAVDAWANRFPYGKVH
jgi:hypothetical protein